jgi:thiaminase
MSTSIQSQTSCDLIINKFSSDFKEIINNDFFKTFTKMSDEQFSMWLSQEFTFVQELMKNFASCLQKASNVNGVKTFAKGITFLNESLRILESKMMEHKLQPTQVEPKDENRDYIEFLKSIRDKDYKIQAVVNWLICMLYNQVIERNQVPNIATEIVQVWRDLPFTEFMNALITEVDVCLSSGDSNMMDTLQDFMPKFKSLEINSWKMLCKNVK